MRFSLTPILFFLTSPLKETNAVNQQPGPEAERVEICHHSETGFHTITISTSVLSAYKTNFGDYEGHCNLHCDSLCDDGNLCTRNHNSDCEGNGCMPTPFPAVDCDDSDAFTKDSCINEIIDLACEEGQTCIEDGSVNCCGLCALPNCDSKYAYVGCYREEENDRAMPKLVGPAFSIEGCIVACAAEEFEYAGLQWYGECRCGDHDYHRHGIPDGVETQCDTPCEIGVGMCGGSFANSVYKTTPNVCP
jgi:hypothetical protein